MRYKRRVFCARGDGRRTFIFLVVQDPMRVEGDWKVHTIPDEDLEGREEQIE